MARPATVPVADPSRAALAQRDELSETFGRFLTAGRYIHGPAHAAFEEELAAYLDLPYCVGVASGTDALELALIAVGCTEGDSVIVAANCGGYAATAARKLGLRVQLADIDPRTLCLSAASVEAGLGPETKGVVVTHLYGLLADIEAIVALCHERDIVVVEDCAQAAGAARGGVRAGAFGDVGTFSFYPTKNLAALGDGGAVATNRRDIADGVRRLRQYGWEQKYTVSMPGGRNSRLDELQAAVLSTRLVHLDRWNRRRREIVEQYGAALRPQVGRFVSGSGDEFVAHLAVAVVEQRTRVRESLEAAGVRTDIHYPVADHRQPAWAGEYGSVALPVTDDAVGKVFTVPCFPELTDDEVGQVCEALRAL